METRLQHILLAALLTSLTLFVPFVSAEEDKDKGDGKLRINSELFDIGILVGVLNIEDFPSEPVVGANITFKASEDFFLQYNYIQSEVSESSFEKLPNFTVFGLQDGRAFKHYDLLVGYTVFQGEFFASEDKAHLSSLYLVGGIGDTNFGGEENFTYTFGVGYQIEFFRRYLVRFDYRDYLYRSSLVLGNSEKTVQADQISVGVGYLF